MSSFGTGTGTGTSTKSQENKVVLSFHETLLRNSDVDLLRGPYWLNDQIISFYFEYLENVIYPDEKNFLFVSPEVTQCIKIVPSNEVDVFLTPLNAHEKNYIFFPLNDNDIDSAGGSHWSLCVYSKRQKQFFHYDSSNVANSTNCRHFVYGIRSSLNCSQVQLTNVHCLQQTNGYDCGIHVICMTEQLCEHIRRTGHIEGVPLLSSSTVETSRRRILSIIQDLGGRV